GIARARGPERDALGRKLEIEEIGSHAAASSLQDWLPSKLIGPFLPPIVWMRRLGTRGKIIHVETALERMDDRQAGGAWRLAPSDPGRRAGRSARPSHPATGHRAHSA